MSDWSTDPDLDEASGALDDEQPCDVCGSYEPSHTHGPEPEDDVAALPDGVMPDGSPAGSCLHPPTERVREDDGTQVCGACGNVVVVVGSTEVAVPSSGQVETFDVGQGVLEHLPWPPGPQTRPYTPEDVEHELVAMVARLNSGARYEARITRELGDAEHAYELAYAQALLERNERSKELREAAAKIACREQWDRLAQLRTDYRTTRAGMHTLRAQLNAMQTVNASVRIASGGGR